MLADECFDVLDLFFQMLLECLAGSYELLILEVIGAIFFLLEGFEELVATVHQLC